MIPGILTTSISACMRHNSIRGMFQCFGNTDIGLFLVPFLLVFAILYGILNNVDVVKGRAAALISIALSLLIAFQVQSLGIMSQLVQNISSPFVLLIVIIMIAWIFYGLVKEGLPDKGVGGSNFSYTSVAFIIIVIATLFFLAPGFLGGLGGAAGGAGFLAGNLMVIIVLIILIMIIAWVISGDD